MILIRAGYDLTGIRSVIIVLLVLFFPVNVLLAGSEPKAPDASSPAVIKVSFKLDPRLTRSMYMGDRWISPATYKSTSVSKGETITVWVKAMGLDAKGRKVAISPEWIPEDSDMVAVSPRHGNEIKIIIKSAGQSVLQVVFGESSKILTINATYRGNTFQTSISQ
jgi:hypothetical protein